MKVLLTSCGLETKTIENKFLEFIEKEISQVKALFIPTAAIYRDAINVLPKCINDLHKVGIQDHNITVFDLHKPMSINEVMEFDVVYLCGGDPSYLLERVNAENFNTPLMEYIKQDKIVIGVSAGSIIFCKNLEHNLGLVDRVINVHYDPEHCEQLGDIDVSKGEPIKLSNEQAIVLDDKNTYVI